MGTIKYDPNDPNPMRLHLQCRRGDIGEYVIVPGDPFRTDWVASFFDDAKLIAHSREIKIYTGTYKGLKVSVCSTGMGCPSAAIVCEELCEIGAKVLLRTGSGFMMGKDLRAGDVAITVGTAKYEGTTEFFVPKCYPCVADHDLVTALARVSRRYTEGSTAKVHTGITACVDAFYGETEEFLNRQRELGIMNLEMESAAVITTAMRFGVRGGCICTCGEDDPSDAAREIYQNSMERQLKIALDSFVELERMKEAGELVKEV